jgi:hypothetical protein
LRPGDRPAVILPTADEMNDFQRSPSASDTAPKVDRGTISQIALDRHLGGIEIKVGKQSRNAGAGGDAARIAIEGDADHLRPIAALRRQSQRWRLPHRWL